MPLLEVDPIKLSDPDALGKAYRKRTESLGKLADRRLLVSDEHRAQDALQRLVNEGGLDKTRLSNVGAFNTKAMGEGINLPGFGSDINRQITDQRRLAQSKLGAEALYKLAQGGFVPKNLRGDPSQGIPPMTAAGGAVQPLGTSVPLDVQANEALSRTEGKKVRGARMRPDGTGWDIVETSESQKGPRPGAPQAARHLPDRALKPEEIESLNAHVAAAALQMPGIITGNEKIIEEGQDERGTFFIIEVQGKDGRPRKFTIRPKGQTR
jgi:hypothetical protein